MQNRVIEIHDSVVDRIYLENGIAVLHFPQVYIHSSEGRPAVDEGTGWTQEAVIRVGNAQIEGMFSPGSRESWGGDGHSLYDGSLRINGSVFDLIPIPPEVRAEVELSLECWGEIVRVRGNSVVLELCGTPKYVEEFQPNHD